MVAVAAVGLLGTCPGPVLADTVGVQVTLREPAQEDTPPFLGVSDLGGPGSNTTTKSLAELAGVPPIAAFLAATGPAMTIIPLRLTTAYTLNPTEVVSGESVSGSSVPEFGVFQVPSPPNEIDFQDSVYCQGGDGTHGTADCPSVVYDVTFAVNGVVLRVPSPTCAVSGKTVTCGSVPSSMIGLGISPGAPPDTGNGQLQYSWDFGDGTALTSESASPSMSHTYPAGTAPGTQFDVRVVVADSAANPAGVPNEGISPTPAVVTVGDASAIGPGQTNTDQLGSSSLPGDGGLEPGGNGPGSQKAQSSGPISGSVHVPTATVAPRTVGPQAPPHRAEKAPSPVAGSPSVSASGSSGSHGAGGSGRGGSGRGGGGGAGRHGTGAVAAGSPSSGVESGPGGAHTPPQKTAASGPLAPGGLTGVLIESAGSPLSGGSSVVSSPLSLLQSLARRSSGSGGSGGLPAWLLGVVSLAALIALGMVREVGPAVAGRFATRFAGRPGGRTA